MPETTGQEPITPKTQTPSAAVPPPTKTKGQEPPKEGSEPPAKTEGDNPTWDTETKSYISKLRSENASWRKKHSALQGKVEDLSGKWEKIQSAISGKEEDPQEAITNLQSNNEQLVAKNAILEAAIEHGIPAKSFDYWAFKITQAAEALDENEDLGEEDLAAIAKEVKAVAGVGGDPAGATTGVTPPKTPTPSGGSEVTAEDFKKMGFLEKSRLQQKDPDLYAKLKEQSLAG